MTNWEEQKFGDLYLIPSRNGLTRPSSVRGAGYKFINMGEIFSYNRIGNIETELVQLNEKEKKEMTLQKNDLLFARQSLVFSGAGKCSIMLDVEDVVSFESHLIRVRLNPEIANPMFYYYYFSLPYNSVKTIVQQCAQAGIRGSDLEKIKVPCPHIEIQNQIADILSTYDDLIEANNRRIELLEQTAQELYKEWFVRFRFPGYENTKFENGLPKGWNVVKLGDYVDIKGGKRLPEGKTLCGRITEHPYIRIRDITASKFISLTNSFEYIDDETFDIIQRFTVNTNDVLVSIVGTIGAIACVGKSLDGANLTENCVKLVNVRHFTNSFLYHFLNSDAGKGAIQAGIVGATQPKLPLYNIKRIKLLKPDAYLIVAFTEVIEPIDREIMTLMDKNRNLATQRDMLLPRLMSGKLEV